MGRQGPREARFLAAWITQNTEKVGDRDNLVLREMRSLSETAGWSLDQPFFMPYIFLMIGY